MTEAVAASLPDAEDTSPAVTQEATVVTPPARPEYEEIIFRGDFSMKEITPIFNMLTRIKKVPILFYLTSDGGTPGLAMQLVDRLNALDVPVTIISELYNASTSALFPHQSDFIRLAYPHSVFTYHYGMIRISGMSQEEVENQRSYVEVMQEKFVDVARQKIGLSKKEFKKYYSYDNIMYGFDCLNIGTNGMVDGLILEDYRDGRFLIKTRDGNKVIDVTIHRRGDLATLPVVGGEPPVLEIVA